MSVVAAPSFVEALGSGSISTNSTTATVTGGTPPYTYAWSYNGGDPTVTIDSPALATTSFSGSVIGGDLLISYFVCDVTDSGALGARSNQVVAQIQGN